MSVAIALSSFKFLLTSASVVKPLDISSFANLDSIAPSVNFIPPKAVLPLSFKYFAKFGFDFFSYLESSRKSL